MLVTAVGMFSHFTMILIGRASWFACRAILRRMKMTPDDLLTGYLVGHIETTYLSVQAS